jgi:hypothetical protein
MGLPPNSKNVVLPRLKPADDTSTSPTKITSLQPARKDDGATSASSAFPEMPSPGVSGEAGGAISKSGSGGRTLVDKDGVSHSVSYAVAIYP